MLPPEAFLLFLQAASQPPPAPLKCLERWYAIRAEPHGSGWFALLPDGEGIPYDDGKKKTFEERLNSPDVKDAFLLRYRPGPIQPVRKENEDPGRIRLEKVFAATYGKTRSAVDVVKIQFLGKNLYVNRKVVPAFERVDARLRRAISENPSLEPFLRKLGGTFVWRTIAGTDRQSAHSYGVSMDIDVDHSHYWRWQKPALPLHWRNRIPQVIVDAFEAEGFIWGGRWFRYDTMHFEYRPELLDPSCYPTESTATGRPANR